LDFRGRIGDHGAMTQASLQRRAGAVLCLLALTVSPALAKGATCFATDDGRYPCTFEALDDAGSFMISAPGKPSFTLNMESPGVAFGSAVFEPGGRSVALPGMFRRNPKDPACWVNDATSSAICAW